MAKRKEVQITVEKQAENGDTYEGLETIVIKKIKTVDILTSTSLFKSIYDEIISDPALVSTFNAFFGDNEKQDNDFMKEAITAILNLVEKVPQKVFELIALYSRQPVEVLEETEIEEMIEIIEAIFEVNDLEKTFERLGESSKNLKDRLNPVKVKIEKWFVGLAEKQAEAVAKVQAEQQIQQTIQHPIQKPQLNLAEARTTK